MDGRPGDGDVGEDETVVDSEQGNVLSHIISQLRPGADLSRVTLPTFILEPRSMLERITNFMSHPEALIELPTIDDPVQRFVAGVRFYLSGWHIKPPGVKKPLNPILGETFTGWWDYADGTRGYYISEQTSHHPPKSSYFFMAPEHHIRIDGTLKPRSKFLGNSVGSFMEGIAVMRFLNRQERYFITQPNMYARGILFGKMKYELGDHAFVRSPELGLEADIEFKVKGWVGGTYNAIGGHIKDTKTGKNLFELSGLWHGEMFIKDLSTGKKELLFDATRARPSMVKARPLNEQGPEESQRLWDATTRAIKKADQKVATDEKSKIEDEQRRKAAERGEDNWKPKLFKPAPPGDEEQLDWVINAEVDNNAPPEKQVEQILAIVPILPAAEKGNGDATGAQEGARTTEGQSPNVAHGAQDEKDIPSRYQTGGTGDLIDFGQHDGSTGSAVPSQPTAPTTSASHDLAQGMSDMNIQQQPPPTGRGEPIRRTDSMGNEDVFIDAET
ncbi:putative OSBP family protein [Teratosphaeria destructans]|uniref:OSBP family protein n=1 Tax=Teratosphaeria destructans TaxID=418781 RepID=A0A9W7W3J8_9PEZI|nr:putative OSBP family protein [Teratosphaeria destructans]